MYNMEIRFRNQVECESGKRYNRIGYNKKLESCITGMSKKELGITRGAPSCVESGREPRLSRNWGQF